MKNNKFLIVEGQELVPITVMKKNLVAYPIR